MKTKPITFLIALTFLFLISGFVYGEEPEIKREFHKNGKLKNEIHFKNGVKEGLAIYWYESGKKKSEQNYKSGKKDGLYTEWHESGKKKLRAKYKNGKFKQYLGTESEDLNIDESQKPIKEFTGIY